MKKKWMILLAEGPRALSDEYEGKHVEGEEGEVGHLNGARETVPCEVKSRVYGPVVIVEFILTARVTQGRGLVEKRWKKNNNNRKVGRKAGEDKLGRKTGDDEKDVEGEGEENEIEKKGEGK